MNLVRLEQISHQYSERVLLEDADLLINTGDRIGLIGPNGSGKTTLLRIVAGLEPPTGGSRVIWGGVRVQFLPQDPDLPLDRSVLDYLFESDHLQLLGEYERINRRLQAEPANAALQARLAELGAEMTRTNGWAAEAEAKTILTQLGITDFDAAIGTLSGGQRRRVALAHALIDPADLLILDEPTNHIDAVTITWLEDYLAELKGALLMVTHDRYFLGRVVNRIVELDRRQLVSYEGNYERYLEKRAARHEQLATAEKKRQSLLRRELDWLRRSPMARGTKQKARIQRVTELQQISYDSGNDRVALALAGRRLGKRVLEATGLSKAYGEHVLFTDLDFQLNPGDRLGIVGPNGSGKTTFLNVLAGKIQPDSGQISWGSTVELGYYDQQSADLRDDLRVVQYINTIAPLIKTDAGERVEAAQMLEWFLFTRREQQTYIGDLSGGERRRLYLLRTLVHQPNVLFLDEPTNDLDIETLAVLETFLDQFKGCLVVVTHDRYFLDRNVDFIMSFSAGVVGTRLPAPYETYRRLEAALLAERAPAVTMPAKKKSEPAAASARRPRRLTWAEKKELAALDETVDQLATRQSELEAAINAAGSDYEALADLAAQLETARADLAAAEERWLELSAIAEAND